MSEWNVAIRSGTAKPDRTTLIPVRKPSTSIETLGGSIFMVDDELATAVAIITIGTLGLLMFSGRVPTRRAIEVVLGCFVLFGASTIASGIVHGLNGSGAEPVPGGSLPPPPIASDAPVQKLPAQPYDRYAGAALPPRH